MILVTGGAGFIGSNVVAALADAGQDVAICDQLGNGDKWRNVAKHALADIVAPDACLDWLAAQGRRIEAVVHLGAISSTTERDLDALVRNNFRFSLDLWHWCAGNGARLIYASSAATYGDGAAGFDDDNDPAALAKLRPLNGYGWSKQAFDRRAIALAERGGPAPRQWVGLKFFNVYGPNEYHKDDMRSVVCKAYPTAAAGDAVTLFKSHHPDYADGGQSRDFIYVRDCVDVILWLLERRDVSGLFNLGTGKARSFADLIGALFKALGANARIAYADTPAEIRDKYQYFTEARMDRLRAAGYDRPFTSLEDGVADYVRNYLAADDPYR